jgi:hypothetical protein
MLLVGTNVVQYNPLVQQTREQYTPSQTKGHKFTEQPGEEDTCTADMLWALETHKIVQSCSVAQNYPHPPLSAETVKDCTASFPAPWHVDFAGKA